MGAINSIAIKEIGVAQQRNVINAHHVTTTHFK